MAKFVQQNFDVYGIAEFKNSVQFDSSVYLQGVTHISSPVGTTGTPYALVVDNLAANEAVKSIQLGTMATETATSYPTRVLFDASLKTIDDKNVQQDASLNAVFGKTINVDTSLNAIWSDQAFQDLDIAANTEKWGDSNRNGLLNQTETTLTFVDSTGVFTLGVAASEWSYYLDGQKYTFSGPATATLPGGGAAAANRYYIYINNNTDASLLVSTSVWDREAGQLPIAFIDWDVSNGFSKYWMGEERHTMLIDTRMHKYLHNTRGTQFISGGTLDGPVVSGVGAVGVTDASNALGVAATTIADEDIYQTLTALTKPATPLSPGSTYNVFYRTGASDWSWKSEDTPLPESGSYIEYDNGSGLSTATAGNYVNTYLVFTNLNGKARYSIIPGQGEFTTLAGAIDENYASFDLSGLPVVEYVAAWQFTWEASTGYTTKGKVALASAPVRIQVNSATASTPTTEAHNDLLGLQGGSASERYHLTLAQYNNYAGKTYIDGSINQAWNKLNFIDTSLNALDVLSQTNKKNIASIDASLLDIDTSLGTIWSKLTNTDASVTALDVLTQSHTAKLTLHEASLGRLTVLTNKHDSSIGAHTALLNIHESSLGRLTSLTNIHDVSIGSLFAYNLKQDTSIYAIQTATVKAWNGLTTEIDNSIGLGGDLGKDTVITTGQWQLLVDGTMQISGDLTVDGSITYLNTAQLDVSDNIININTGLTGAPPVGMVSGMQVKRGSSNPYFFIFSEVDDTFRIGINASEGGLPAGTQAVATRQDAPTDKGIAVWNDTAKRFDTSAGFTFDNATGLNVNEAITVLGGASLQGLSAASQTRALMTTADGGGTISTRVLGSNAFTSTAYAVKADVDSSLGTIWAEFNYVDSSFGTIWTKLTNTDASVLAVSNIVTGHTALLSIHEASLGNLNTKANTQALNIISIDASIARIDASLNDVIEATDLFYGKVYIDGSLATRDASLLLLSNNKYDKAGGALSGLLTFASQGFQLDSVTITDVDSSGFLTGLDTHMPTSGAVQQAIAEAIVAGVTASNGLHESGGDIRLGGTLTVDTSITTSAVNRIRFNGLLSDASEATVYAESSLGYLIKTQLGSNAFNSIDYAVKADVDASFALYDTKVDIDASFALYKTKVDIDASFGLYDTKVDIDASFNTIWTKLDNTDSSVLAVSNIVTGHTNELAVHDTSIGSLFAYNLKQDASIYAIQTATVKAWNGLTTTGDGSIGLGSATALQIPTTITATASNTLSFGGLVTSTSDTPFAMVQDSAAAAIKTRQLGNMAWATTTNYTLRSIFDASIGVIYTRDSNQDTSIFNLSQSLGSDYVKKSGDLMTGGLQIGTTGAQRDASIFGNLYVHNNTTIGGNLYVDGSLFVTDVHTIDVSTGFIRLNTGLTGAPPSSMQSGIVIERGSYEPYVFIFDESNDTFRIGVAIETSTGYLDASTQAVATREDTPTDTAVPFWNGTLARLDTDSGLTFVKETGLQVDVSITTAGLNLTGLSAQNSETTSLMINNGVVGTRELGSNAFTSTAYAVKADVDSSFGTIWTKLTNTDASVLAVSNIVTGHTALLSIHEASLGRLTTITNKHDASIGTLTANKLDSLISSGGAYSIYDTEVGTTAYIKGLNAGTGATIVDDGSALTISVTGSAGYVSKFAYAFTPAGVSEVIAAATHGLGTKGPFSVDVWEWTGSALEVVYTGVSAATNGNITLSWSSGALTGDCSVYITA